MFPLWLILGFLLVLAGIFHRQVLPSFGIKPMSDVFSDPSLARSRRLIEKLAQWLVITIGISFLVQGLAGVLPNPLNSILSFLLLGVAGLMILAVIGITVVKWKVK
jgi:hypothetical protein